MVMESATMLINVQEPHLDTRSTRLVVPTSMQMGCLRMSTSARIPRYAGRPTSTAVRYNNIRSIGIPVHMVTADWTMSVPSVSQHCLPAPGIFRMSGMARMSIYSCSNIPMVMVIQTAALGGIIRATLFSIYQITPTCSMLPTIPHTTVMSFPERPMSRIA